MSEDYSQISVPTESAQSGLRVIINCILFVVVPAIGILIVKMLLGE